jgi:hypothetical protein
MSRSVLLVLVVVHAAWGTHAAAADTAAEILVQTSLTAGLAHHDARAVWGEMRVGDVLDLVRERDNPHDPNAVRVAWRGHTLGYVPRTENEAVARQIDRGSRLSARIASIEMYRNHRRKLGVEIFVRM